MRGPTLKPRARSTLIFVQIRCGAYAAPEGSVTLSALTLRVFSTSENIDAALNRKLIAVGNRATMKLLGFYLLSLEKIGEISGVLHCWSQLFPRFPNCSFRSNLAVGALADRVQR